MTYYEEQLTFEKTDKNYHIAEYVKSHGMSLIDFDCWSTLQTLTGDYNIDYETYHAVDNLLEENVLETKVDFILAAYDMVKNGIDEVLLPCPFCGNRALSVVIGAKREDFECEDALCIECPSCRVEMWEFSTEVPKTMRDYDNRIRHLVQKWNTRFEHDK